MKLRFYQSAAAEAVKENARKNKTKNLVVIAVGGGKSVIMGHLGLWAKETQPNKKILFVTHRKELSEQNADKIRKIAPHLEIGFEKATKKCPKEADVMLASIQTVGKESIPRIRLWCDPKDISMVVIDEAHHIPGYTSYQLLLKELLEANPEMIVTGFTGTPHRSDGERIDKYLDNLAYQITLPELIQAGYLARLRCRKVCTETSMDIFRGSRRRDFEEEILQRTLNNAQRNRLAIDTYLNYHKGEQSLAFCTGKKHAEDVAELFRQNGVRCEAVTDDTPEKERERIIQEYHEGKIQVLSNATILTEGFDSPMIKSMLLLRPTKSASLLEQMIGRVTRLCLEPDPTDPEKEWVPNLEKKSHAVIYEFQDRGALEVGVKTIGETFDLPKGFDFQGEDIFEVWGKLQEARQNDPFLASAMMKALTKEELDHIFNDHNLLAELQMLHYNTSSDFDWLNNSDEDAWLPLAHSEITHVQRTALGNFQLNFPELDLKRRFGSDENTKAFSYPLQADNMEEALQEAAGIIEKVSKDDAKILRSRRQYRLSNNQRPATPAQIEKIKNSVGIHPRDLERLTMSQAGQILDRLSVQAEVWRQNNRIPAGKYAGVSLELVSLYDPGYLKWMLREERGQEFMDRYRINPQDVKKALTEDLVSWFFKEFPRLAEQEYGEWIDEYAVSLTHPGDVEDCHDSIRDSLDASPNPPWERVLHKIEERKIPKPLQEILADQPKKPERKSIKARLWETPTGPDLE
jgi:superfamily II DNA or RNA helicase